MGAQIALHCANAGIPALLLDLTPRAARERPRESASGSSPIRSSRRTCTGSSRPAASTTACRCSRRSTGSSRRSSSGSTSSSSCSRASTPRAARLDRQLQHLRHSDRRRSPKGAATTSAVTGSARTSSIRRDTCGCSRSFPRPDTDPAVVETVRAVCRSPPRQGRGHRQGHAELHRQPHRALRRGAHARSRRQRPLHDRRGRCHHRTRAGPARQRHVPHDGHRRRRRPRARHAQSRRSASTDQRRSRGVCHAGIPAARCSTAVRSARKPGAASTSGAKTASGESEIWTLDLDTLDYRPRQSARIASIEAGKIDRRRPRSACGCSSTRKDKAGQFLRETLAPTLVYTARVTPDIAHSIDDVDRVMRWGFAWELGPFELFDAIGVREVLAAAETAGGHAVARRDTAAACNRCSTPGRNSVPRGPGAAGRARSADPPHAPASENRIVRKNAGASLVDLGDGVFCVEFHSKMNAIGGDTMQMLQAGVKEATRNGRALVVGNDAPNFSAGANLMLVLLEAQEGNWDEIDLMIRTFQQVDDGAALQRRAGRRRARRARRSAAAPRLRCTPIACRRPPKPTWASSRSASA